jgi:hypothetical protein
MLKRRGVMGNEPKIAAAFVFGCINRDSGITGISVIVVIAF